MNICVFGDSITWGACDYEKGGWVERLKSHDMQGEEEHFVFNVGVSGDNSDKLLKRFPAEATAREPEVIIFAIGVNDSQYVRDKEHHRVSLEKFKQNILELTVQAKALVHEIIFVGITGVDESKMMPTSWDREKYYDNESIEKYNDAIKKVCEEKGSTFIPMEGIVGIADLEDGLHPNAAGHKKMFQTVLKVLNETVKIEKRGEI